MNYNETSQWAADLGSGYSSIRPLGEGGMGTLYRAHKDSLDVISAVREKKGLFPLWKKATQTAGKKVIKDILLEHSTPADKIL